MQATLADLKQRYPQLHFRAGRQFTWSPETDEIMYRRGARGKAAIWALLHETGHALLGHRGYAADFELLRLESEAWQRAHQLAADLDLTIDEEHVQDCLDTYRDWLYKRSICPDCATTCLQQGDFVHYRCFNCHTTWRVSASRFCRAYRRSKGVIQPAATL